jgi:non-ribosomal peptide synthetase component F
MLDMHHIISDGISAGIAMKDFMAFFGRKELPELTLQYKDFSEWQNNNRKAGEIKQQENYWLKVFEGEIPVLKLPGDYPRPQHRSFEGASVRFSIGEKEATALKEIMLEERTTLHILLLAIYNLLLAKISGQEDIVVGMAAAGRRHEDLQGIIGMFLNMLAIRNHPKPNKTFKEFLREVKARALEAYDNQDYQFEDLVGKVVVNRAVDRHPLFDTAFGLQNMELPEIKIPGLKLKPYRYEKRRSKVDLLLIAVEAGGNIDFVMEYNTQLFKVETIERFILYFKRLVASILENPHQPLKNMHITSEEEVHEIMMIKSEAQQAIQIDFDI